MELTPLQRKFLTRYRDLREGRETLRFRLKPLLPRLAILVALIGYSAFMLPAVVTAFATGMLVGAALRQVPLTRGAKQIMPVLLDVIDWDKVDERLGDAGRPVEAR
ncbi:hypothetical protein [Paludisphaera borealis]|uniref:Uncharacterized protein n=1 Tax=Paludisphaera borealis TaxID=1387353 RepID=A0A1U7CJP0_9BACT|nr:hypothetical protein [Paludisphaera borealis]APW59151.1 hypothetical protein BSF38_00565 [Paludisphaera borealis]